MPRISVGGVELNYQFQGKEDGPTLVLVNGLLTDTSSWAAHLPAFVPHFRVLTYDCRGQGGSDKPNHPYLISLHAADLLALLDKLGIESAHFIGLSNGGSVVQQFAVNNPERVLSMIVIDSYARTDALLKAKLISWVAAMDAGGSPLRFDVATPWVWGGEFLEKNLEALAVFREKGRNLPIEPARNLILGAMTHDVLDRLSSLQTKTLVVVGEDDLLTPVKLSREIAGAIPGAELAIIPGAGHASCLEKPADFVRLALDFYRRLGVIQ